MALTHEQRLRVADWLTRHRDTLCADRPGWAVVISAVSLDLGFEPLLHDLRYVAVSLGIQCARVTFAEEAQARRGNEILELRAKTQAQETALRAFRRLLTTEG